MKRALPYIMATLAIVAVIALVGRASSGAGADRARTEQAEASAVTVAIAYRGARARTDTVVRVVRARGARVDGSVAATRTAIDSARAVLADGLQSELLTKTDSVFARIRATLGTLTVTAEALVAEVVVYRATVDTLTLRLAEERAANDRRAAAQDAVIRALKGERCRIRLVVATLPCPTRTQSAIGGVVVTLAALAVLSDR